MILSVLPRGRNFVRKSQKGSKKIVWSLESEGPNFWAIYQKRAEKWPNFVVDLAEKFCHELATLGPVRLSCSLLLPPHPTNPFNLCSNFLRKDTVDILLLFSYLRNMIFKLSTGFYYFKHAFLFYYKYYLCVQRYCTLWQGTGSLYWPLMYKPRLT
jgi:hypothetical protein